MSDSIDRRVSHSRQAPTRHALAPSRRYRRWHMYQQCRAPAGREAAPSPSEELKSSDRDRTAPSFPAPRACCAGRDAPRAGAEIRQSVLSGAKGETTLQDRYHQLQARGIVKAPAARGNRLRRAACHARRAAARRPRDGRRRAARPQGRGSRTMIQLCTGGVAPTGNSHSRWTTKPWRS